MAEPDSERFDPSGDFDQPGDGLSGDFSARDRRPVLVCGLGRFGLRIVEHLHRRRIPTIVIADSATRDDRRARAERLGVRFLPGDFRFADVRAQVRMDQCRALILAVADNDSNISTALEVRHQFPELKIAMRLTESTLAARLERDFGITAVLAPPNLAAPAFVRAALQPPEEPVDAVPIVPPRVKMAASHDRSFRAPRVPEVIACLLVFLFAAGIVIFSRALHVSYMDAAYFTVTTLTTVGFGDYNLQKESAGVKLFGMLLMVCGVVFIAILSSVLTNFLLSGRMARIRDEQRARRMQGHVIVCGLGTVGSAIVEMLRAEGKSVVVVDTAPFDDNSGDPHRAPVLVADATNPDVLLRAGLERARALIAAVSSDSINLEVGLAAQTLIETLRPDRPMRLVIRCFDADLSRRIHQLSRNYTVLSSAEIAAPIFIDAVVGSGE